MGWDYSRAQHSRFSEERDYQLRRMENDYPVAVTCEILQKQHFKDYDQRVSLLKIRFTKHDLTETFLRIVLWDWVINPDYGYREIGMKVIDDCMGPCYRPTRVIRSMLEGLSAPQGYATT